MAHPGLGRQMDGPVDSALPIDQLEQGLAVGNVELTKRESVAPLEPLQARPLQGGIIVIVQVVDPDHLFATAKQRLADVIADEPGGAGDE